MRFYVSNDLNEVRSVWCFDCKIAVKTELVTPHFKSKHSKKFVSIETPHFKSKPSKKFVSIETLIAEGDLAKNYETFHMCFYCGDVMDFSERKIIGHLSKKKT